MVIVIVMFYDDYNDQVRNAEPRPPTADPGMDPPLSSLCSPNGVSWFQWLWIWDDDIVINQKTLQSTPFLISSDFPGQPSTPTCLLPLMTSPCSDQPMSKRRLVIAMTAKYSLLLIRIFCPGWWGAHQRGLELFAQVSKIHHQVLIRRYITKYWLENSKNVKVLFMSQFKPSLCSTKYLLKIQFKEWRNVPLRYKILLSFQTECKIPIFATKYNYLSSLLFALISNVPIKFCL